MNKETNGKILFLLANIISSPLIFIVFFTIISFLIVLLLPFPENYKFSDNVFFENVSYLIVKTFALTLYISAIFCLLKILLFPLLYLCRNRYQYISDFFYKFYNNNIFAIKIFFIAIFTDILSSIILKNIIFLFVGVFSNYLLFLLFFKIIKIFHIKKLSFKSTKIRKICILIIFSLIIFISIFTYFYFSYIYKFLMR